jgi:hypothetical protein
LLGFALVLAVAATASVGLSALSVWLAAPLCGLAWLSGLLEVAQLHRCSRAGGVRALIYQRGRWSLQLSTGALCSLELCSSPLLSEFVLAARFRLGSDGGCYRLFLLSDMTDVESWRRTCLALRQGRERASG